MNETMIGLGLLTLVALVFYFRFVRKEKVNTNHNAGSARRSLSVLKPAISVSPVENDQMIATATSSKPEDEGNVDGDDPTPEELVAKFWPADSRSNADKAGEVLREAERETGVDWDEEAEDADPAPSEFVESLRAKGCTTVDLLIAVNKETGLLWGEIIAKVLEGSEVSVAELIEAQKGCPDEEFGSEELDSILDQEALSTEEVYVFARGIGISCERLMELHEDRGHPDFDEIAEPAREAGYTDAEIMDAISQVAEDYGTEVAAALSSNIPLPTIIECLFSSEESAQRIEDDLIEADVEFEVRIDILYGLIHHPPVASEDKNDKGVAT